jgi:hypothetical protein
LRRRVEVDPLEAAEQRDRAPEPQTDRERVLKARAEKADRVLAFLGRHPEGAHRAQIDQPAIDTKLT